jgi:Uma2 family endonuclease
MMAADPQRIRMTLEEYFQLNDKSDIKYEYHHGYAIAQAGGTGGHSRVKVNLTRLFDEQLYSGPCYVYDADMLVEVAEDVRVYPDLTVSCDVADHVPENAVVRSPHFLIEVLSPSTESTDRLEKSVEYRACASVEEYALVSTRYQMVEVFRKIRGEKGEEWVHHVYHPGQEAEFASLDITIPVSAIYHRTGVPLIEDVPPLPGPKKSKAVSGND